MTPAADDRAILSHLDDATRALIALSALLAGGSDDEVRSAMHTTLHRTPHPWIEELLLQTYLFAGFPRALNGMREWRRVSGKPAPASDAAVPLDELRRAGEATCARVYGPMYDKLRVNIRELHPLLDEWMVTEGYGKVLSRPALDLPRRELCIVAACAATGQDRQLQSHLHGARNVGVSEQVITQALESLAPCIPDALLSRANRLWQRIRHDVH
jgi:4-carboxymuconolactone decarboxylase